MLTLSPQVHQYGKPVMKNLFTKIILLLLLHLYAKLKKVVKLNILHSSYRVKNEFLFLECSGEPTDMCVVAMNITMMVRASIHLSLEGFSSYSF